MPQIIHKPVITVDCKLSNFLGHHFDSSGPLLCGENSEQDTPLCTQQRDLLWRFNLEARSDFPPVCQSTRNCALPLDQSFKPRWKTINFQFSVLVCFLSRTHSRGSWANLWVKFSRTSFHFACSVFGSQLFLGPLSWVFLLLVVVLFCLFKCECLHSKTTSDVQPKPLTHHYLLNEAKHHKSLNGVDLSLNCCFEITTNH